MRTGMKVGVLAGGLLLAVVSVFWWSRLSDLERWLIIHRQVVDKHVSALLAGRVPETPDAMMDATVNAGNGVVVITFHDDPSRALVFAQSNETLSEYIRQNPRQLFRKLTEGWYEAIVEGE